MMACKYLVSRWSSPHEWTIEEVPMDYVSEDEGGPVRVCDTFTEAKAWLIDQTEAWYHGFRDDMREVRALRKSDVPSPLATITKEKREMAELVVHVNVAQDASGVFFGTSPQLTGLLVAKQTAEGVEADTPRAARELYLTSGKAVPDFKFHFHRSPARG